MDSKLLSGKWDATVEKYPLSVHPSQRNNPIRLYKLDPNPRVSLTTLSTAFHSNLPAPSSDPPFLAVSGLVSAKIIRDRPGTLGPKIHAPSQVSSRSGHGSGPLGRPGRAFSLAFERFPGGSRANARAYASRFERRDLPGPRAISFFALSPTTPRLGPSSSARKRLRAVCRVHWLRLRARSRSPVYLDFPRRIHLESCRNRRRPLRQKKNRGLRREIRRAQKFQRQNNLCRADWRPFAHRVLLFPPQRSRGLV